MADLYQSAIGSAPTEFSQLCRCQFGSQLGQSTFAKQSRGEGDDGVWPFGWADQAAAPQTDACYCAGSSD
ncbi:hypothetical protein AJ88_20305 [Mesorhizobium amorphae CCBAU 01583]|nr:hypothetical protein AJ88_20305 [Mesorhizobium amorphae CCBAU 01583]